MIEEAHTKWALLSSPALFLNASAMAALSTADALKQEGRRALVVGADKAKLASLALGRPETMVGEGGELVLRAQGPARRWGGGPTVRREPRVAGRCLSTLTGHGPCVGLPGAGARSRARLALRMPAAGQREERGLPPPSLPRVPARVSPLMPIIPPLSPLSGRRRRRHQGHLLRLPRRPQGEARPE